MYYMHALLYIIGARWVLHARDIPNAEGGHQSWPAVRKRAHKHRRRRASLALHQDTRRTFNMVSTVLSLWNMTRVCCVEK